MSTAKKILEKLKEGSNQAGEMEKSAMGIIEKLMNNKYSDSKEKLQEMVKEMGDLVEMDDEDEDAHSFMEYVDNSTSKYSEYLKEMKNKKVK